MDVLLDTLATWPGALWLQGSGTAYLFLNAAHILGLGLLLGAIVPLDLRLAGLWRELPLHILLPFSSRAAAAGLSLVVVTGLWLFTVRARTSIWTIQRFSSNCACCYWPWAISPGSMAAPHWHAACTTARSAPDCACAPPLRRCCGAGCCWPGAGSVFCRGRALSRAADVKPPVFASAWCMACPHGSGLHRLLGISCKRMKLFNMRCALARAII